MMRRLFILLLAAAALHAHAPITPAIRGPLSTDGTRIVTTTGTVISLRGAVLPNLEAATVATLGVLRLRWNMNAVRIPLSVPAWQRDGQAYIDRVNAAIARSKAADLYTVLTADEAAPTPAFWTALATALRNEPQVAFSLARKSAPANGQALYDAIRATGARQLVTSQPAANISGENVVFEIAVNTQALQIRVPSYVAEWATPNCADSADVFQALSDFDTNGASWTAATFEPNCLLRDTADYDPLGMGASILSWMTGDPIGFGYLRKEAVASAVGGGPAIPASPGALLSLYIEQMGPAPDAVASLDANGRIPTQLGGTQVLFDGQPVPILFAGQYQLNVQAPYTLTPGKPTEVQVLYRGVPSNRVQLEVVEAQPELFHDIFTRNAIAFNENGTRNSESAPAAPGSIVVFFGAGTGRTTPEGTAGQPSPSPHPLVAAPVKLRVANEPAEILFAGEVPGFVGLTQINARLPRTLPIGALLVNLEVANRVNQSAVTLSVR